MNETERERREPDSESKAARRAVITRTAREESSPCVAAHLTAARRTWIRREPRRRMPFVGVICAATVAVAAVCGWNARPVREIRERTAWNMGRNGATLCEALAAALQGVGKTSAEVLRGAAK